MKRKLLYNLSELVLEFKALFYNYNEKTLLTLIGGCSRSGKSYISNYIKHNLKLYNKNIIIVNLDHWLLSINQRKQDSTVLERYDVGGINTSIPELLKGKTIFPPIYDPITRLRICESSNSPIQINTGLIIVEGVIALAIPELLELSSLNIFVDNPDEVRKSRLSKFYLEEKKVSDQEYKLLMEIREEEEVPFIKSTKINAEIIFNNSTNF